MTDYEEGAGPLDDNVDVLRDDEGEIGDAGAADVLQDEQDPEQNEP